MKSLSDYIAQFPDVPDAAALADGFNAQPPTPKPSGPATYVTYLSIGEDVARFGAAAINFAGKLRTGLVAWIAGPDLSTLNAALPNTGALQTIGDRLAGAKGVDLSSVTAPAIIGLFSTGVPGLHEPILTADQADALLTVGYDVVTPVTVADVRRELVRRARRTADDALAIAFDAEPAADLTVYTAAYSAAFLASLTQGGGA